MNVRQIVGALALCAAWFVRGESALRAETFPLPPNGDTVVGRLEYVRTREEETLIDVAREFDLGYDQIISANPQVNRWVPGNGTKVLLPHLYILPAGQRQGLVMNLPELRIYYFPTAKHGVDAERTVMTFPVSIGRMDWRTPLGMTKVVRKDKDPSWTPTESIRAEHAREGEILPKVIPGGAPDNPLGHYALRLGFPGYLIHGVDERKSFGIGMRVTHGCVRMYPEDIERLFALVAVNTPVQLVDQPVKVGWKADRLYLEVHQPFDEQEGDDSAPAPSRIHPDDVIMFVRERVSTDAVFDENAIRKAAEIGDGVPVEIGRREIRLDGSYEEPGRYPAEPPRADDRRSEYRTAAPPLDSRTYRPEPPAPQLRPDEYRNSEPRSVPSRPAPSGITERSLEAPRRPAYDGESPQARIEPTREEPRARQTDPSMLPNEFDRPDRWSSGSSAWPRGMVEPEDDIEVDDELEEPEPARVAPSKSSGAAAVKKPASGTKKRDDRY